MNLNGNAKNGADSPKVIKLDDVPLTASGEPDVAAILAACGITGVDPSQVTVMKNDTPTEG